MGFSGHEYWSGQPFPSPGDLLNPRIEPESPILQADSLLSEPPGKPRVSHKSLSRATLGGAAAATLNHEDGMVRMVEWCDKNPI